MNTIKPIVAVALLLLLTLGGCRRVGAPTAVVPKANTNFPIVQLTYSDRIEYINLRADYGYIIDWPRESVPAFYVFDKPRRSRVRTSTWEGFVAQLRKVPDGSEIDAVSKCTAPFAWGMPADKGKELDRVLSEKSFKKISGDDDDRHTQFCYCETKRMDVLADESR